MKNTATINATNEVDSDAVFADPVGYLRRFGIEVELVESSDTLPQAA